MALPDDEPLRDWLAGHGIAVDPGAPVAAASGERLRRLLGLRSWDETVPSGAVLQTLLLADALVAMQRLTERLRRDCPWDREQTVGTIVPHTIEEAYEVAEAAEAGTGAKLVDELGDLLFQTLLPRAPVRGAGRRRSGDGCDGNHRQADPPPPARVRRAGGRDRRGGARELGADQARSGGPQRHLPRRPRACCPRCSTRARCSAGRRPSASTGRPGTGPGVISPTSCASYARRSTRRRRRGPSTLPTPRSCTSSATCSSPQPTSPAWPTSIPELALRAAAGRFRDRVETAERLAADAGVDWAGLDLEAQDAWYRRAKAALQGA